MSDCGFWQVPPGFGYTSSAASIPSFGQVHLELGTRCCHIPISGVGGFQVPKLPLRLPSSLHVRDLAMIRSAIFLILPLRVRTCISSSAAPNHLHDIRSLPCKSTAYINNILPSSKTYTTIMIIVIIVQKNSAPINFHLPSYGPFMLPSASPRTLSIHLGHARDHHFTKFNQPRLRHRYVIVVHYHHHLQP